MTPPGGTLEGELLLRIVSELSDMLAIGMGHASPAETGQRDPGRRDGPVAASGGQPGNPAFRWLNTEPVVQVVGG